MDNPVEIKKKLLEVCIERQSEQNESYRQAISSAQESANEEEASEFDQMESFREQLHSDTDMYSRKLDNGLASLEVLKKLNPEIPHENVAKGALVETNKQKLFFAVSLGKVTVDGEIYFVLSMDSPLYQAMEGKKKGDSFEFRDQKLKIKDIH